MSGCSSHQRVRAAVHSCARRQLVHLLAPLDHAAVDQPGDDRREFAGGDSEHGFVEQRETGLPLALLDQQAALLVAGQAEQIGLTKALPDTSRSDRRGVGGIVIAGGLLPHHHGHQQVSLFDTLARFALHQALGPGEPPCARAISPRISR